MDCKSFDGQVVRPPKKLVDVAKKYVCVRVVNMSGVDINAFRFDYDLTFAVVLMNADGTIYHRYGGRDGSSPMSWMTMPSLISLMKDTLKDHDEYQKNPSPPDPQPKVTIEDFASFQKKQSNKNSKTDCVHCHMVHTFERQEIVDRGDWERDDMWIWPLPARIGLDLSASDQALVKQVKRGSPAYKAGIRKRDRLLSLGKQHIRTQNDVQWALQTSSKNATSIPVRYQRRGKEVESVIELEDGWKHSTPREYAWRPFKWRLSPGPGFGGKQLTPDEVRSARLPKGSFAFKVTYLATWGDQAHRGHNAQKAGIKMKDIFISANGKRDFASLDHFHAWFRITLDVGDQVKIGLLRNGKPMTIMLTMVK